MQDQGSPCLSSGRSAAGRCCRSRSWSHRRPMSCPASSSRRRLVRRRRPRSCRTPSQCRAAHRRGASPTPPTPVPPLVQRGRPRVSAARRRSAPARAGGASPGAAPREQVPLGTGALAASLRLPRVLPGPVTTSLPAAEVGRGGGYCGARTGRDIAVDRGQEFHSVSTAKAGQAVRAEGIGRFLQ